MRRDGRDYGRLPDTPPMSKFFKPRDQWKIEHEVRLFLAVLIICLSFLVFLKAQSLIAYTPTEFDDKLITFNYAWGKFFRAHFVCPEHAQYLSECHPLQRQTVDYDGWKKVMGEWEKKFGKMEEGKGK